jgi:hypothetical protein
VTNEGETEKKNLKMCNGYSSSLSPVLGGQNSDVAPLNISEILATAVGGIWMKPPTRLFPRFFDREFK